MTSLMVHTYINNTKYGTGMYILQLWIYVFSFLPRDRKLSSGYLKVKNSEETKFVGITFIGTSSYDSLEHILVVIVIPISVVSIAVNYIIWWSRS